MQGTVIAGDLISVHYLASSAPDIVHAACSLWRSFTAVAWMADGCLIGLSSAAPYYFSLFSSLF